MKQRQHRWIRRLTEEEKAAGYIHPVTGVLLVIAAIVNLYLFIGGQLGWLY